MCSTESKIKAKKLGDNVITYLHMAETSLHYATSEPAVTHARLGKLRDMIDQNLNVVGSVPLEELTHQISADVFHIPDGGYTIDIVRQMVYSPNRPKMWEMEDGVFVADRFLTYLRMAVDNEIDFLRNTLFLFDMPPYIEETPREPYTPSTTHMPKSTPPVHLVTTIKYDQMRLIFKALYDAGCYLHPETTRGQWNNVCYGGGGSREPNKIVWIGKGCELRYMIQRYFNNTPKVWERTAQLFMLQGEYDEFPHAINPKTLKNYRISDVAAKRIDDIFAANRG